MSTILIPLDGSPLAESALRVGRVVAQRTGATVRLVHVRQALHPLYVEGLPVLDDQLRPMRDLHERTYLERAREQLRADSALNVECDLLEGTPAQAIARHAAATNSNLIVMTSHGYGGFERFWLGSVADTLVRVSEVPILLCRPHEGREPGENPFPCRAILVPLDGATLAEQILPSAAWLARAMNAPLHLLRVLEPSARAAETTAPDPLGDSARAEAEGYLRQVSLGLEEQGCRVESHLLFHEQPARAILACAGEQGVDLIAMATHGRGEVQRLLLGSVSDKVLRSAPIPLLLYRPQST